MATAIACDLCETEQAVMMQTSLVNGETISVGQACLIIFMGGAFAGMLDQADNDVIAMHEPNLTDLSQRIVTRLRVALPTPSAEELAAERAEYDTGPREDCDISVPDTDGYHDYADQPEDVTP